ncbi:MAG TPA: ATP-binding protein, partial [Chitinophagales bacterium]|nr:ATP-binding protein [Chitinophagales bacterium]
MKNPKPIEVFENPANYIDFLTHPDMERVYGQWFDWKEVPDLNIKEKVKEITKGIIKCISAFANSNLDGGIIVLGINNNAQVIGTEHLSEKQLNSMLSAPNQDLRHHSSQSKVLMIGEHRIYLIYTPHEPRNICHTNNRPNEAWKR